MLKMDAARTAWRTNVGLAALVALLASLASPCPAEEVLPKHITPETLKAVKKGWTTWRAAKATTAAGTTTQGGEAYPVAMTALAGTALLAHGRLADPRPLCAAGARRRRVSAGLHDSLGLDHRRRAGAGRPMHGHGFALMFLASAYGMETNPARAATSQGSHR